MQLESLLNGINNELDKIRNSIKECLRNTQLNKDDIAVRKKMPFNIFWIFIILEYFVKTYSLGSKRSSQTIGRN